MRDTLDRDILISYSPDGFISSVTDFAGRSVRYSYYGNFEEGGNFGDLKSVTTAAVTGTPNGNDFPNGKTTRYTYSKGFPDDRLNHNLLTITDGRGITYLQNTYYSGTDPNDPLFDRVIRQIRGTDIVDLTYVPQPPETENGLGYMKTIVHDRNGNVIEYTYNAGNLLVREREFTGRCDPSRPVTETANRPTGKLRSTDPDFFETSYEYNQFFQITRIVRPNGNITENVYESDLNSVASARTRNNLRIARHLPGTHIPAGDQPAIEERYEYDTDFGACGSCGFNFVTKYTDGRANTILSEYDGQGNLITRTNQIASIVERFAFNKRGQTTNHVLPDNGGGSRRADAMTYYESGPQRGFLKEEIIDAGGFNLTTRYEYDLLGNVVKKFDPRGHDTQFAVNQLDQVVREISPEVLEGSGVRYTKDYFYDANNNLVRLEVQNRRELLIDAGAPLQSAISAQLGFPVADGGIVAENPMWTATFDYDILNFLTNKTEEVEPGRFISTQYAYDGNRNRTLTRFGEATAGRQPDNVVKVLYDERNLPFREIRAPNSPLQSTTQFDYDGNQNRISVRSGLEATPHITTIAFDGYNRLVSTLDAMGNVTTNNYDANGNRIHTAILGELVDVPGSANNVRLSEKTFTFDLSNRMTRQDVAFFNATNQTPIGDGLATMETVYTDNSQVLAVINDNHHGWTNRYDSANRLQARIDAKGNRISYDYDRDSNMIKMTEVEKSDLGALDEVFVTTYGHDSLNRLTSTIDNIGNINRSGYDSRNNRTITIDANTNVIHFAYDGLSRLTQTTRVMTDNGVGSGKVIGQIVTKQTWDDSSRLISQIDDNGNATTYLYDGLNRKLATLFADGSGQTNVLDVHGTSILFKDGAGNRVTNIYDALDRLVRRNIAVGTGVSADTTFEIYKYDGLSRMTRAEDDDSVVLRSHDSLSHVTQEIQNGAVVGARFDGVGNQTQLLYPGGRVVNTTFDDLERIKVIRDTNGVIAAYNYTGPRRVAQRDYGNGTRCEYNYDGLAGIANPNNDFGSRNIVRTRHTKVSDGTVIDDRIYVWDRMGNKTQHKDVRLAGPQVANDFAYDSAYRMIRSIRRPLTGAGETNVYEFDGVGNRLSVTSGDDSGAYTMSIALPEPADLQVNQYSATPFDSRTYDHNGNLKTVAGASAQNLVCDYRNQLVEVSGGGVVAHYGFDALGRRVSRHVSGVLNVAMNYFYNSWRVSEERHTNDNIAATYTYGIVIDELLMIQRTNRSHFVHSDDLNSVFVLSDASGERGESYGYGDYGRPSFFDSSGASTPESLSGNVTLYTARRFDPESQLYEYRTRHFDPRSGRFITRDSIGVWGDGRNQGNALTYVGNNPSSLVDPYGIAGSKTCSYTCVGAAAVGGFVVCSVVTKNPLVGVFCGAVAGKAADDYCEWVCDPETCLEEGSKDEKEVQRELPCPEKCGVPPRTRTIYTRLISVCRNGMKEWTAVGERESDCDGHYVGYHPFY